MDFKDKTVKEVKELTKQFKEQNPEIKTAEELLEGPKCKICGRLEDVHKQADEARKGGHDIIDPCKKFSPEEGPKVLDITELI